MNRTKAKNKGKQKTTETEWMIERERRGRVLASGPHPSTLPQDPRLAPDSQLTLDPRPMTRDSELTPGLLNIKK